MLLRNRQDGASHDALMKEALRGLKVPQSGIFLFLIVAAALWTAIGIYSAYATYRGFERLNWGRMALILTVLSQLGAMTYQILIARTYRHSAGLARWPLILTFVLMGLLFHVVSFSGSIYYHRETSRVSVDKQNVEQYIRQYEAMVEGVRFNLEKPYEELGRLQSSFRNEAWKESNGIGVTELPSVGPYARSYDFLTQAAANLKKFHIPPTLENPFRITENDTDDQALASLNAFFKSLPPEALRVGENQETLSLAQWRNRLPSALAPGERSDPARPWLFDPTRLTYFEAERLLKSSMAEFPFRAIQAPTPVQGAPEEVFTSILGIFGDLESEDPVTRSGAQAGMVGAALTEVLTLILNFLFVFALGSWTERKRSSAVVDLFKRSRIHLSHGRWDLKGRTLDLAVLHLIYRLINHSMEQFECVDQGGEIHLKLGPDLSFLKHRVPGASQRERFIHRDLFLTAYEGRLMKYNGSTGNYLLDISPIIRWHHCLYGPLFEQGEMNADLLRAIEEPVKTEEKHDELAVLVGAGPDQRD